MGIWSSTPGDPTVTPTIAPTQPPAPSNNVPTQHWAGCGRVGSCPTEEQKLYDSSVLREVRCCSDVQLSGFTRRSGCEVYSESEFGQTCYHNKDFGEAEDICSQHGGRLCTKAELEASCTSGTGCQHDRDIIWSSTPAEPTSTPTIVPTQAPVPSAAPLQHWAVCGSVGRCSSEEEKLYDHSVLHEVRCCSDVELSGWTYKAACDVWAESKFGQTCYHNKDFWEAEDICSQHGGRLCTKAELEASCTSGTGC